MTSCAVFVSGNDTLTGGFGTDIAVFSGIYRSTRLAPVRSRVRWKRDTFNGGIELH